MALLSRYKRLLGKSTLRHDASAAVQQGFNISLENTQEETIEILLWISPLDQTLIKRWNNLFKKAAEVFNEN